MADQTLNDFFSGPRMTELMQSSAIKGGTPDPLPAAFSAPSPEKPVGMNVQWDQVNGNRKKALVVHHTSPSKRVNMEGVTRKFATAIGAKNDFQVDTDLLLALKSDQPVIAEQAKREVVRRMKNFRDRFDELRKGMRFSALSKGKIWVDKDGNLLTSSSGALITIDFGLPAALSKVSTVDGVTLGDWSSAATDIPASVKALRTSQVKSTNYNPTTILYGKSIPSYLAGNTLVQAYLARNPGMNDQLLTTNEIPKGLLGFNWVPMELAFDVSESGTVTSWWADNQITVVPDVSPEWYEYIEAGTLVPNGLASPTMTPDELIAQSAVKNGYFSYAEMTTNPVAITVIGGDYTLPTIKVGSVVVNATVS